MLKQANCPSYKMGGGGGGKIEQGPSATTKRPLCLHAPSIPRSSPMHPFPFHPALPQAPRNRGGGELAYSSGHQHTVPRAATSLRPAAHNIPPSYPFPPSPPPPPLCQHLSGLGRVDRRGWGMEPPPKTPPVHIPLPPSPLPHSLPLPPGEGGQGLSAVTRCAVPPLPPRSRARGEGGVEIR